MRYILSVNMTEGYGAVEMKNGNDYVIMPCKAKGFPIKTVIMCFIKMQKIKLIRKLTR